jgi:RNA polymerase sigma-70 factor (ECF subfamily)
MSPTETLEKQYERYRKTKASKDLAVVFSQLAPALMRAARRAGLDQQGAEDAVQETFLAVIAGEDRFEEGRPVVPWVRGIALRQINAERRRQARLRSLFYSEDTTDESGYGTALGERGQSERHELRRKIEAAIQTLSEGNQRVVRAALLEGLGIEEIANRLNLSRTATSVRLHRGLRRVRKQLGERSSLGLLALTAPKAVSGTGQSLPVAGVGGLSFGWIGLAATFLAAIGGAVWLLRPAAPVDIDSARVVGEKSGVVAIAEEDGLFADPSDPVNASTDSRVALAVDVLEAEESPAASAPTSTVTGMVRSKSGLPSLPGAPVFALRTSPELVLPTAPLVPIARTEADGQFTFDTSLVASDESPLLMVRMGEEIGWTDVTEEDLASGQVPEIVLHPQLRVDVTAKDELGRPLEGVKVAAFSDVSRFMAPLSPVADEFGFPIVSTYEHLFGAVTNHQGTARVGGLFSRGDGDSGLMVVLTAKKEGHARGMLAYIIEDPGGLDVEFILPSVTSLRMEGAVVDGFDQPIAGVQLRFRVRGEAPLSTAVVATTDAAGSWEVPSHLLDEFPLFLAFDRQGFAREEIVVLEPTELTGSSYVVQMKPSGTFEGKVHDESGAPVAGAEVTVATIRSLETTVTAADGSFQWDLPLGVDRSVTVTSAVQGQPTLSARAVAPRDSDRLVVGLPAPDRVAATVVAQLGAGLSWKDVHLVPFDVSSTITPLHAVNFTGAECTFENVPHGQWVLSGMTHCGASVINRVAVGDSTADDGGAMRVAAQPVRTGSMACVFDTDGLWSSLSGGDESCTVIFRHKGVDRLPNSAFETGLVNRPELYMNGKVTGHMELRGMLPGDWQIMATGPGWATLPVDAKVEPGEAVRVDLMPVRACTLKLELPAVARSCYLRFSIRRTPSDDWAVVAIPSLASGMPEAFAVQVPEGRWLWKCELEADNAGATFSDVTPPTYGEVNVEPGSTQLLRVLDGSLEVSSASE